MHACPPYFFLPRPLGKTFRFFLRSVRSRQFSVWRSLKFIRMHAHTRINTHTPSRRRQLAHTYVKPANCRLRFHFFFSIAQYSNLENGSYCFAQIAKVSFVENAVGQFESVTRKINRQMSMKTQLNRNLEHMKKRNNLFLRERGLCFRVRCLLTFFRTSFSDLRQLLTFITCLLFSVFFSSSDFIFDWITHSGINIEYISPKTNAKREEARSKKKRRRKTLYSAVYNSFLAFSSLSNPFSPYLACSVRFLALLASFYLSIFFSLVFHESKLLICTHVESSTSIL